jgi:hypothetical protein
VLLTRPPLDWKELPPSASLDLHVLSTPPAFILSQDQTLHLNLFHRPGPKSEPVEEEPNLLSRKQETLLFSKSRKKTSGTLYSVFKEPDPGFSRGRAVPPAQLPDNSRPKTEISEYEFLEAGSTKT